MHKYQTSIFSILIVQLLKALKRFRATKTNCYWEGEIWKEVWKKEEVIFMRMA